QRDNPMGIQVSVDAVALAKAVFHQEMWCGVGKDLNEELDSHLPDQAAPLLVKARRRKGPVPVRRVGSLDAKGAAAALAGNILVMDTPNAITLLGRPEGMVDRLDLMLEPGHDREKVRQRVQALLERHGSRAAVTSPEENDQNS